MNYVVVKRGVYHQGTWGPYPTQENAEEAARILASADRDDYHAWEVHTIHPADGLGDILFAINKSGPT